jgi:hypothetical protein
VKRAKAPARRRGRLFRVTKRLLQAAFLAVLLATAGSSLFIGLKCYSSTSRTQPPPRAPQKVIGKVPGYAREEVSTFLTLPEWYIVYNTEEYARFIGTHSPAGFPYGGSIAQYWRYYGGMCDATQGIYPFSGGNHMMLAVIGSSFTAEYALKGLYENTIGRLTEWIAGRDTPEDVFAHKTALEYGGFMHTVPWYEFPFFSRIGQLWRQTPMMGPHLLRKWERKLALTAEFTGKGIYGWLIGVSSGAAYGAEDLRIHAWIENAAETVFADGVVSRVEQLAPRSYIVTLPRYEAFTTRAKLLVNQGVRFMEIAGNDDILVTVLARAAIEPGTGVSAVLDERFLTENATRRIALSVPVRSLHEVILRLEKNGVTIEHIYDY